MELVEHRAHAQISEARESGWFAKAAAAGCLFAFVLFVAAMAVQEPAVLTSPVIWTLFFLVAAVASAVFFVATRFLQAS